MIFFYLTLIANLFFHSSYICSIEEVANISKKKSIAIFGYSDARVPEWDPDSVKSGIVGSEEAVIFISQELAKMGYSVTVFANPPKNSPYSSPESNPRFIKSTEIEHPFDIVISWRNPWIATKLKKHAKKVYFWPHDVYQGGKSSEQVDDFDEVLWLSQWQRENWIANNEKYQKFINIFGNGIEPHQFKPLRARENPYSCIYGSNYARGLEILLEIWPEIKKEFPKATLDIYYGWQHWGLLPSEKEEWMRKRILEMDSLGVHEHGMIGQVELNEAYAKASFWTYPCILPETFCISALRAQLSGAIPVIIEGTALAETVPHGFKCSSVEEYKSLLLKALGNAEMIDFGTRNQMREFVLNRFTWRKIAEMWSQSFEKE